jgi:(E)-4-hydroxy-3-methylbut-2-enyl-diphosphate synthase
VVNGPGEAREADLGIAAGRHKGHLFIKGKIVRVVPEAEMVDALVAEAQRIVAEGIEARIAAADAGAEAESEADRRLLFEEKGADANRSEEVVLRIREHLGRPDGSDGPAPGGRGGGGDDGAGSGAGSGGAAGEGR